MSEEKVEAPKTETADDYKAKYEALQKERENDKEIIEKYNTINQRFAKDEKFQEGFKAIWEGRHSDLSEEKKSLEQKIDRAEAAGDSDRVAMLEKKLAENEQELLSLKNMYGHDKIVSSRAEIDSEYMNAFNSLAESKGYRPGSKAAEALFDSTIRKANNLASEYGLVRKDGSPDPLLKFTPKLLEKAFESAYETHKQMGYDIEEHNRRESLKEKKAKEEQSDPVLDKILDPKKLSTFRGRTESLEQAFKHTMKKLGVDPNNFKMT